MSCYFKLVCQWGLDWRALILYGFFLFLFFFWERGAKATNWYGLLSLNLLWPQQTSKDLSGVFHGKIYSLSCWYRCWERCAFLYSCVCTGPRFFSRNLAELETFNIWWRKSILQNRSRAENWQKRGHFGAWKGFECSKALKQCWSVWNL